jgi:hypothetical protein
MHLVETFTAYGNPNVTATHRTTIMTTKDSHLTKNGDCIAAIKAEKALADLSIEIKEAVRNHEAKITLMLNINEYIFKTVGRGHPNLIYSHRHDIVARKSNYICDRTLMIGANKAACDIPPELVSQLQRKQPIIITISVEL